MRRCAVWVFLLLVLTQCSSKPYLKSGSDLGFGVDWDSETTGHLLVPLSWTTEMSATWQKSDAAKTLCPNGFLQLKPELTQLRGRPSKAQPHAISISPTSFNRSGGYELPNSAFAPMNEPDIDQSRAIPFECAPLHPSL